MRIAFRADASTRMGTGHTMRCVTLARALRDRGADVFFVCRDYVGNLIPLLQQEEVRTVILPRPEANGSSRAGYAGWLEVSQTDDAADTARAMHGERTDWLVVDSYGLGLEWERQLRPHLRKLMVIDDLGTRPHDCDVLLDQNYSEREGRRYAELVPKHCQRLLGPHYALLRPEYAHQRKTVRRHRGQVGRTLVFLGGTDTHNVTGLVLQALSERDLLHLHVDVVVGTNNSHRRDIEGQATARGNTTVHGPAPHLADLLSRADLAIGAGGATTWERMCLGVPTVLISIAENQQPSSEALARAQLVSYAGHLGEVSAALVAEEIRKLLKARRELIDTSVRNQLVVDGLGTPRIVEVLYPTAEHHLRVRGARGDDIVLFYNWANDAAVRANAFNTDPIAWTTHEAWFSRKLRSSDSHLFVLEANGLPIGQIRFDMEDGEARIDYSLDEFVRGRGWGARLLALGMDAMRTRKPTRFKACVKGQNVPSRSAFVRLGFTLDRLSSADRLIFYKDAENAENRRAG